MVAKSLPNPRSDGGARPSFDSKHACAIAPPSDFRSPIEIGADQLEYKLEWK